MVPLSSSELLDLWEDGAWRPPGERALTLAAAAGLDLPAGTAAGQSVGERDASLLELRQSLFGGRLEAIATCPACAEELELELDLADLGVPAAPPPQRLELRMAGFEVSFRVPSSLDAVAGARSGDVGSARQELLRRCLLAASRDDRPVAPAELPEAVQAAVAARMADADPQADVELDLACPACGHRWRVIFDIGSYLWSELEALALRLLDDVVALASAYGWSEAEVLSLSPHRRRHYLDAAG
jgi:hypothetical protein